MRGFSLLAGLLVALALDQAAAQQPTQAERDAIRAACRSDFIANCVGVEPGGKEAFECLIRNDAKLSASCRTAVDAARPKPAEMAQPAAPTGGAPSPAAAPEPAPASPAAADEQLKTVQKACTLNDLVAHCSWIAPTNPEILLCLKANTADLSPGCQAAVQLLPATAAPAATAPPAAASAPPASPEPAQRAEPAKKPAEPPRASVPPPDAAAAPQPTEQQKAAIRAACRSDFMARCRGVQPGGAAALQCLQRNAGSLSGACKSAVAAVGAAAPAAGAPAAAAPAAAPIGPIPQMRPREALAIVQICRAEVATVCAGIPFGGGRVLTCLAENAASLSPQCAGALRAAAGR